MFTPDGFFLLAMIQRYGVTQLRVTTGTYTFSYLDERNRVVTMARPILAFSVGDADIEKPLPLVVRCQWVRNRLGIATQRIYAVCEWTSVEVENYIKETVANLNNHPKGSRS